MWLIQNLGFDSFTYSDIAAISLYFSSSLSSYYNCFSAKICSSVFFTCSYDSTVIASVGSSYDSGSYGSNIGFGQWAKKSEYADKISSFWNMISRTGFFFTRYPAKLLLVSTISTATKVFNTSWNSGATLLNQIPFLTIWVKSSLLSICSINLQMFMTCPM